MTWTLVMGLLLAQFASSAVAQGAMPEAAAAALRNAQAAAAEAISTYERHFPDQPLWRTAITEGERARELAPGRLEPLRFLAQVYGTTGWLARTWESWQAFLAAGGTLDARSRADAAEAALTLGYQAYAVGAYDRARQLLSASYQLAPGVAISAYLGQTELILGNAQAASPLLEQAVATYPQLQPQLDRARLGANHGLAAADAFLAASDAFARGDSGGALAGYQQAAAASPTFLEAVKGAAAASGALGRVTESRQWWTRAAALAPADAEVAQVIASFAAADTAAAEAAAAAAAALAAQEEAELAAAQAAAEQAQAALTAPALNVAQPPTPAPPPVQEPAPVVVVPPEPEPIVEPEPVVQPEPEPEPVVEEPTPAPQPVVVQPPPPPQPPPAPVQPVVVTPPAPVVTGGPSITLIDTTLNPRSPAAGGDGAFTFVEAPAEAIGNLDVPYDYGGGTLHLRVEVLDKPTAIPVLMQLCLVPDNLAAVSPACSPAASLRLGGSGIVTATQSVSALEGGAGFDWARGMSQLIVVLRDADGRPLDPRYATAADGSPLDVSAHYPMSIRVRAVLVPLGSTFAGW